jgi:hypothetical protein
MSVATSNARDSYILGVGPIQDGTIYHGTHFAGSRWQIPVLSSKEESPPMRGLVSYYDEMQFDKLTGLFKIPKKRTPEELNAEIESIVKVPRLSPLTEAMFAAMDSARPPAAPPVAPPDATADGAAATAPGAASGESAPPEASAPAATVAERPKPLPAVEAEAAPDAAPSETAAPATAPPTTQPPSPQPAAEATTPPPTVTR